MATALLLREIGEIRNRWGWFLTLGILLIVIGVIALGVAGLATVITVVFFGWLLVLGGIVEIIFAFRARESSSVFLQLLTGLLALIVGALLVARPGTGALTITLLLAALYLMSGVFRVIVALVLRYPNWGWVLVSGLVTFLLGLLLLVGWPSTALWFIGVAVGIDLILHGWSWIAFALAARRLPEARA